MHDLQKLETDELVDLLAYMTGQLTLNITEKNKGAIEQYEYDISVIQSEINSRKQTNTNTSISDPNLEITSEG